MWPFASFPMNRWKQTTQLGLTLRRGLAVGGQQWSRTQWDCQFREANVSILHEWLAERPLPHLPGPPTSGSAPLSDTPLLHDRNL